MLTLHTNQANLISRLFSLSLIFYLEYLVINNGFKEPNNGSAIYLLYFVMISIGFLIFTLTYSLLCINKVQIDTTLESITFIRPFNKQTILTIDISEYFETSHKFRWNGLLIITTDNKTIQVVGQNIKSLSIFKNYLDERNIFNAGQKQMKYPFN